MNQHLVTPRPELLPEIEVVYDVVIDGNRRDCTFFDDGMKLAASSANGELTFLAHGTMAVKKYYLSNP